MQTAGTDEICLQDDFKISKKIATGGFGTVYRAELDDGQTPGGRPVIIKKVSCNHALKCALEHTATLSKMQPCMSVCMLVQCIGFDFAHLGQLSVVAKVGAQHLSKPGTIIPEYQILRVYSCLVGQKFDGQYHMLILLDHEHNSVTWNLSNPVSMMHHNSRL